MPARLGAWCSNGPACSVPSNPPIVVIHGNSLEHVTDAYKRYLEGRFRDHFKLVGTPLRIEMRSSRNPFDEK